MKPTTLFSDIQQLIVEAPTLGTGLVVVLNGEVPSVKDKPVEQR